MGTEKPRITMDGRKVKGAYYTPEPVVETLLGWAIRNESDRLLDPSCGDGNFISRHRNSVGIEQDRAAAELAIGRAPWALVHEGDFFAWAGNTEEKFDCIAGNPPFIRYQTFKGAVREAAQRLCARAGARFSGLSSSWAPFLVGAATLLKPGGRMAFVVPAEIGHAPYAAPLVEFLVANFGLVHVVAVKSKLFPDLSEDCWLLYADGYGGTTATIRFSAIQKFRAMPGLPSAYASIDVGEWRNKWKSRLRPFVLPQDVRNAYQHMLLQPDTVVFRDIASVGIGYVSGANDFFHLRPSEAESLAIPDALLQPSVRSAKVLPKTHLTNRTVHEWAARNERILLLRIPKAARVPRAVRAYLDSEAGQDARQAYKCRSREPWYSVPDVQVPHYFLSYMSGRSAALVRNDAGCTCTNAVHAVRIRAGADKSRIEEAWDSDFVKLSCEIEGHPLGGGMLKLEPREAGSIVLPSAASLKRVRPEMIADALDMLRDWRHCAAAA
jgi:adenine-specific DNA-methyltransferase